MVFDIYSKKKNSRDKVIIGIYTICNGFLIFAMVGQTIGGGEVPTIFERLDLPISAYIATTLLVLVIFILTLSKIFSSGISKRLTIESKRITITTSILQNQSIIDWAEVNSILPSYENWDNDLYGQLWSLNYKESKTGSELLFIVMENELEPLKQLIREKLMIPTNTKY